MMIIRGTTKLYINNYLHKRKSGITLAYNLVALCFGAVNEIFDVLFYLF